MQVLLHAQSGRNIMKVKRVNCCYISKNILIDHVMEIFTFDMTINKHIISVNVTVVSKYVINLKVDIVSKL